VSTSSEPTISPPRAGPRSLERTARKSAAVSSGSTAPRCRVRRPCVWRHRATSTATGSSIWDVAIAVTTIGN